MKLFNDLTRTGNLLYDISILTNLFKIHIGELKFFLYERTAVVNAHKNYYLKLLPLRYDHFDKYFPIK